MTSARNNKPLRRRLFTSVARAVSLIERGLFVRPPHHLSPHTPPRTKRGFSLLSVCRVVDGGWLASVLRYSSASGSCSNSSPPLIAVHRTRWRRADQSRLNVPPVVPRPANRTVILVWPIPSTDVQKRASSNMCVWRHDLFPSRRARHRMEDEDCACVVARARNETIFASETGLRNSRDHDVHNNGGRGPRDDRAAVRIDAAHLLLFSHVIDVNCRLLHV